MEWEAQLRELWKGMTIDQAKVIYMPILVRALSRVCPEGMVREDAEDIIVAITREAFAGVEKVFLFMPHEVGLIEEIARLAAIIAVEMKFAQLHAQVLEWHLVEARFEHILTELGQKIAMASAADLPKLVAARQRVLALYEQWRRGSVPSPRDEEPPGNAPLGARPKPPVSPVAPALRRTVWEAEQPPRNP